MIESNSSPAPRLLFFQHRSIFESYGGVEYYLHDVASMATELFGRDRLKVLFPLPQNKSAQTEYDTESVERPSNRLASKLFNRLPLPLALKGSRSATQFQPNFIVCGHTSFGPTAKWLSQKHRVPLISIVYGIDCWGAMLPHEEWALRHSDGIISISEWTKNILVERGYDEKKIAIVHPRLPEHLEQLKLAPKIESRKFRILTVSRLDAKEQYKGHDHMLHALYQIKKSSPRLPMEYTILGEGSDERRLRELCTELQLNEWVRFQPALETREELDSAYRNCDLFAMPSRFGFWDGSWRGEGFGIVYVEAAALEAPSIAYRCGGAIEIISDNRTGWLIEPDDVTALAGKLHHLALHRDEVKRAGQLARPHVIKNFGAENFARQLAAAFEKFTQQRSA